MRNGCVVVGRFGAPVLYTVTRYAADTDTVVVRRRSDDGRPYGKRIELPAFAVADPEAEQRYAIVRCNEQVNEDGEVTQRWWKTYHFAYGLPAVKVLADLHVPESDRWNWFYQPVHEAGERGEEIELQTLYDRMPEEA